MTDANIEAIRARLGALEREKVALEAELERLAQEKKVSLPRDGKEVVLIPVPAPTDGEAKADLFLRLFCARKSVYPRLWENSRTGKKGYSPMCRNEWDRFHCGKPKVKCSDCPNQSFPPLDREAVINHLQGKHTIGTYAICEDNACIFLAADFDGEGWRKDVLAYKQAAMALDVDVHIERSRSGNGAHAWIFFEESVSSTIARRLGTIIVTKALAAHAGMKLTTYDRFFPNQDTIPKGGFGNLIALPLQRKPRDKGNTVFLDENLEPVADQWLYLANASKVSKQKVRKITEIVLPPPDSESAKDEETFSLTCDENALDLIPSAVKKGSFCGMVEIQRKAQLEISTKELPRNLLAALKRLAMFPNPKFYQSQRLRFPTYNIPRFIFCGEIHSDRLVLPRGVLEQAQTLIKKAGGSSTVSDLREVPEKVSFAFHGKLNAAQDKAVKEMLRHEQGVLVAPPGAGKTVIGCALIAERKVPVLILVHRRPLLEQWKKRLMDFLQLKTKDIHVFGKKAKGEKIAIGMFQTLVKSEYPLHRLSNYGLVIIDECHHVPAASFEAVMKQCPTRYIVGLTATPKRKDGLQKILHMQCGPVRHEIENIDEEKLFKKAIVQATSFKMEHESERPPIHLVWEALVNDNERNEQIARDILDALHESRFSIVLSDRKNHLTMLQDKLLARSDEEKHPIFMLDGSVSRKKRNEILEQLQQLSEKEQPFALLATASLIGEGFDLPRLDTLFLAMPISFKGRLIQYAGRLHRTCQRKRDVLIYDYIDSNNALCLHMLRKRLTAYRQMGYHIDYPRNYPLFAS